MHYYSMDDNVCPFDFKVNIILTQKSAQYFPIERVQGIFVEFQFAGANHHGYAKEQAAQKTDFDMRGFGGHVVRVAELLDQFFGGR